MFSPTDLSINKTTTSTPCRRLGLARKTPTSQKIKLNYISESQDKFCSSTDTNTEKEYVAATVYDNSDSVTTPKRDSASSYVTPKREGLCYKTKRQRLGPACKSNRPIDKRCKDLYEKDSHICFINNKDLVDSSTTPVPIEKENIFQHESTQLCKNLDTLPDQSHFYFSRCTEENLMEIKKINEERRRKVQKLEAKILDRKKRQEKLKDVTERWLKAGQEAVEQLAARYSSAGYSMTVTQLLDNLQIPHSILHWNAEEEEFEV